MADDDRIPEGNVDFEPREPKKSIVYYIRDHELAKEEISRGRRTNLHDHTMWSGRDPDSFIRTWITRFLGVRESMTKVEDFYLTAKKNRIDYVTASDHNSIKGALMLREMFEHESPVSSEYTANGTMNQVSPNDKNYPIIHVLCPGIDFPVGEHARHDQKQVKELHKEIMRLRYCGLEEFKKQLEALQVRHVLAHAGWIGNPNVPLEPELFLRWIDTFDYIEINGSLQLENILALEMAQRYNKTLVAGTDDHSGRAVGKCYTETLTPNVNNLYEFYKEFDAKNIGIGSHNLGKTFEERFSGSVSELRKDTFRGVRNYLLREWGIRKWRAMGLTTLATVGTTTLAGWGLGFGGGLGTALLSLCGFTALSLAFAYGIPWHEKMEVKNRSVEFYGKLQRYFMEKDTWALDEKIANKSEELNDLIQQRRHIVSSYKARKEEFARKEIIQEPSGIDRLINRALNIRLMKGDYDFSDDLYIPEKTEKKRRGKKEKD